MLGAGCSGAVLCSACCSTGAVLCSACCSTGAVPSSAYTSSLFSSAAGCRGGSSASRAGSSITVAVAFVGALRYLSIASAGLSRVPGVSSAVDTCLSGKIPHFLEPFALFSLQLLALFQAFWNTVQKGSLGHIPPFIAGISCICLTLLMPS